MKLVEILARELKEWPPECEYFFADWDNEVRGSPETTWDFYPKNTVDIEDRRVKFHDEHHIVTRAQWEAERARIDGINEQYTVHPGEAIIPSPFDSPRYDQELWDKVAANAIGGLSAKDWNDYAVMVEHSIGIADFFMAERAKRLKK